MEALDDLFKMFFLNFCEFQRISITKISSDALEEVQVELKDKMVEYFSQIPNSSHVQDEIEKILFCILIQIFCCHTIIAHEAKENQELK